MTITLMSFNLRCDKPDPGERQWRKRVGAIAKLIQHYHPDLLGTQEGKPNQIADLKALLPEYKFIGGDRTGTGLGEHCNILFNPEICQLQKTEDFYLSDTPEIPGSITPAWGNRLPRMVTWGTFLLGESQIPLTMLNTHLDHESAIARKNGADLINQIIAQDLAFSRENYLFITADFNANPHTPEREIFANNDRFQDVLSGYLP
jgi:endonuclease/exonuclease/phosphatase family metal-dependent hydrolase